MRLGEEMGMKGGRRSLAVLEIETRVWLYLDRNSAGRKPLPRLFVRRTV